MPGSRPKSLLTAALTLLVPASLAVAPAAAEDPPVVCSTAPGLAALDPGSLLAPGPECTGGGPACGGYNALAECWENLYIDDFEDGSAQGWSYSTPWVVIHEPCGVNNFRMSWTYGCSTSFTQRKCAKLPSLDAGGWNQIRIKFTHTLNEAGGEINAELEYARGNDPWEQLDWWYSNADETVEHVIDGEATVHFRFCAESPQGSPKGWFVDRVQLDGCDAWNCVDL